MSSDQRRVGPVHVDSLSGQQSPRERGYNRSNHQEETPIGAAIPNRPSENKQKPLLFLVLLFATIVVLEVSVSIAVLVSIRLLNGRPLLTKSFQSHRHPIREVPSQWYLLQTLKRLRHQSQVVRIQLVRPLPRPRHQFPVSSPTITITFSVDELVGLMSSHLPPVPFSPTSSPPEFRAVQWMTETDKNTEGLSDDCLVRRCAMASNGFIISGFNNWTYF